jgi:hypothetical protein
MAEKSGSRLERLANVCIIIVSLLGSTVLVKGLLRDQAPPQAQVQGPARQAGPRAPAPGTTVSLPGVDWSRQEQTLVLMLSTTCRYCTNSSDFYKRVIADAEKRGRTKLVAVFPQAENEAHTYLSNLGLGFQTVIQAPPTALGLNGTPTLLLVDNQGKVTRGWSGQLPPAREEEVLSAL